MKGTLANSVDPDQMPQNAASDQGLRCLHLGKEFLFNMATSNTPNIDQMQNVASDQGLCCLHLGKEFL